jgi:plasmid replication initiation protein
MTINKYKDCQMQENKLTTAYQEDSEVRKNNSLIRCTNDLTTVQRKSFALLLKHTIDAILSVGESRYYSMSLNDYRALMGVESDYSTKQLRISLKELQRKELEWNIDKDGYGTTSPMLAGFDIEKGSGVITWALSPFLIDKVLADGYTPLKLSIILDFTSKYALALYENLQMRKKFNKISFTLPEFRALMGVGDTEHPRMESFKRIVLAPALAELNDKSDMKVNYNDIKVGAKITGFEFYWENLTLDAIKERNKRKEKMDSYREGLKDRIGKKFKIDTKTYTLTKDGLVYRQKILFDIIDSYEMIKKWKEMGFVI